MLKYAELYKEEAKELIVNEKLVSKQSEHQSEYGHSKVYPYHDAKVQYLHGYDRRRLSMENGLTVHQMQVALLKGYL